MEDANGPLFEKPKFGAESFGVVHFAGVVVDRPLVTIRSGALLVTVEPVDPAVSEGDRVEVGEAIGTLMPGHCPRACVHLGVRLAGEYVSPLLYLGGLQRAVLLPLEPAASATAPLAPTRARSGAGVGGAVHGGQSLGTHVGVDLRRAEARVTENLLHRPQIRSPVEQVGRRRVAEGVRARRAASATVGEQA